MGIIERGDWRFDEIQCDTRVTLLRAVWWIAMSLGALAFVVVLAWPLIALRQNGDIEVPKTPAPFPTDRERTAIFAAAAEFPNREPGRVPEREEILAWESWRERGLLQVRYRCLVVRELVGLADKHIWELAVVYDWESQWRLGMAIVMMGGDGETPEHCETRFSLETYSHRPTNAEIRRFLQEFWKPLGDSRIEIVESQVVKPAWRDVFHESPPR